MLDCCSATTKRRFSEEYWSHVPHTRDQAHMYLVFEINRNLIHLINSLESFETRLVLHGHGHAGGIFKQTFKKENYNIMVSIFLRLLLVYGNMSAVGSDNSTEQATHITGTSYYRFTVSEVNNNKLEKLQERSLRIIHNDYEASFETLLKCSKQESLLTKRLKIMILDVFKTVNRLNPSCLHDLFTKNEVVYDLRTHKLEQPKRRTTTYGLRTFSYLGSKLWNLLASEYSEVNDIDYERLKFLIKYWAGPNHDPAQGHFLWSTFVSHVYV